jgi:hypothetical protein
MKERCKIKCKLGKNKGKKNVIVEKRHVARWGGGGINFGKEGGGHYCFRT